MRNIFLIAGLSLLSACDQSAGVVVGSEEHKEIPIDGALTCRNDFAVPGAAANWSCYACGTPRDPDAAIDGIRETYAEIPFPANLESGSVGSSGLVTLRAVLPEGATYPAGSVVGALIRPAAGSGYSETISFATYLDGVLQEYFPGSLASVSGIGAYGDQKRTEISSRAFNAVELIYTAEGVAVTSNLRLYEFCSE